MEFKESSRRKPRWQDIATFHRTTKRYWALWDSLHLRNGVLYRKWESDDGKTFQMAINTPKDKNFNSSNKELHGSPTEGHFGVMKTFTKVLERFYSRNVRSDVEKCCHAYDPCAARKVSRKRTSGRLRLYNGSAFQRIAFDILGPLRDRQMTTTASWLSWITSISGRSLSYSRPRRLQLLQRFYFNAGSSRFGVPLQLHSDQGETLILQFARGCEKYSPLTKPGQQLYILGLTSWGVPFTRPPAIPHPRCYFGHDLRLPCRSSVTRHQMHPWRLRSGGYRKRQARLEEMHHLAERIFHRHGFREDEDPDTTQESNWLRLSRKATKCGYGIRNVAKDSLRATEELWKVLIDSSERLNDVVVVIKKSPHSKNRR
ncbi:retrovirus-related Pol polyprotein from transposon 412 [Trichonephila clavipes]|nr:retrovirus-related Pol polyprotein from transposon 412 [Trichonephila clavipes]